MTTTLIQLMRKINTTTNKYYYPTTGNPTTGKPGKPERVDFSSLFRNPNDNTINIIKIGRGLVWSDCCIENTFILPEGLNNSSGFSNHKKIAIVYMKTYVLSIGVII